MSAAPVDDAALAAQLVGLQTSRYFTVAGSAILVFDYCITFNSEVRWVWGRTWDLTRIMFTISRYVAFVATLMTLYAAVEPRVGENCIPFGHASTATHLISIISAEALLIMRTYAFWHGERKVLYGLLMLGAACVLGSVCISAFVNPGQTPNALPSSPGCIFESSRSSAYQYIFLVLFETALLGLTLYKRFVHYRGSTSSMIATLYRDGVQYISCIILLSIINIIVDAIVPIGYSNVMDAPQIVTHSVLASRILFSLRRNHANTVQQDFTTTTFFLNALNSPL
ncbi:hypothetical protein BJ138DRAFT_930152 [Hygrophoropsis aurantiaca]|uniref:Uncharacterized protein n=1 Tax=Hygrophoropsis aurantiaca TaxID=72124 RepID=A0ACB8AE34_9AGAM|nr:hypothetical protein BJ138DRAFT_930152 [Hygrophoropsis aurantiaca]